MQDNIVGEEGAGGKGVREKGVRGQGGKGIGGQGARTQEEKGWEGYRRKERKGWDVGFLRRWEVGEKSNILISKLVINILIKFN